MGRESPAPPDDPREAEKREHEVEDEKSVGEEKSSKDKRPQRARIDQGRSRRCRSPEQLQAEQERDGGGAYVGERARQPRGEVGDAEDPIRGRHAPVEKWRFLVIAHVVQARLDPVAALEHLTGDQRVAGFGRARERPGPELRESENRREEDAAGKAKKDGRAWRTLQR